jgi:hypothetical protein
MDPPAMLRSAPVKARIHYAGESAAVFVIKNPLADCRDFDKDGELDTQSIFKYKVGIQVRFCLVTFSFSLSII